MKPVYLVVSIITAFFLQACDNVSVSEGTETSSAYPEYSDEYGGSDSMAGDDEGSWVDEYIVIEDDTEARNNNALSDDVSDADHTGPVAEGADEADETKESPDDLKHVKLSVTGEGTDIFMPADDGKQDYRYSISLLRDEDGGIDAWFASPGDGVNEYDWVTYRHSGDDGVTWSEEKVVLSPSPCTPDSLSICDPDAFFHDGYYYVGYTSTINKNEKGLCNSVFIARSEKPEGPYEKWNGSGWGGVPMPIVYFNGLELGWGCGEPSFVVMDDTLYMYSTRDSFTSNLERLRVTDIRTADLRDPMWPAKLEYRGHTALSEDPSGKDGYSYEKADSWDVAYLEESRKFIALCTNRRFEDDSCLLYFESDDGVNFERVSECSRNVITRCHNAGIMTDGNGHIKKDDPVMVGYSYAGADNSKWGVWCTRVAPAVIGYTKEPDRTGDNESNLKLPMNYRTPGEEAFPMMLSTDRLVYTDTADGDGFTVGYYLRDNYRNERFIGKSSVTVNILDGSIAEVNALNDIVPKSEGMTLATVEYDGLRRDIALCVTKTGKTDPGRLTGFCSLTDTYEIMLDDPFIIKVRPMAVFEGWEMHELSNEEILKYGVYFSSSNKSVCTVGGDGTVYPKSAGEAILKVKSGNGKGYDIRVNIKDDAK